eukprot:gene973-1057_t
MYEGSGIVEGKRSRKPKVRYLPEDYTMHKPRPRKISPNQNNNNNRNQAVAGSVNKWAIYYNVIKKAVALIVREQHCLEVRALTRPTPSSTAEEVSPEDKKSYLKIVAAKKTIVATLEAIVNENSNDKAWPQLAVPDEDDMVDVLDILCSRCGGEEEDGNDILFCDHKDCCRAYHQKCLDPPLDADKLELEKDWFCWQCECLDDCLDLIGERLGLECTDWKEVFADVREELAGPRPDSINALLLDDEEEDDGEFNPDEQLDDDEEEEEEEVEESDGAADVVVGDDEEQQTNNNPSEEEEEEEEEEQVMEEVIEKEEEEEMMFVDDGDGSENGEVISLDGLENDEMAWLMQDIDEEQMLDTVRAASNGKRWRTRGVTGNKTRKTREEEEEEVEVLGGERDVGRAVAKVHRGIVMLGEIIAFRQDSAALRLYEEYEKQREGLAKREEAKQLMKQLGALSTENVVKTKREHKAIDYRTLSLQLFGTLYDESDIVVDDDDDQIAGGGGVVVDDDDNDLLIRQKPKRKRGRPSKAQVEAEAEHESWPEESDSEDEYRPTSSRGRRSSSKGSVARGRPKKAAKKKKKTSSSSSSSTSRLKGKRRSVTKRKKFVDDDEDDSEDDEEEPELFDSDDDDEDDVVDVEEEEEVIKSKILPQQQKK